METKQFKKVIEDIVDVKTSKMPFPKYIAAIVSSVNADGTVDVFLPPDTKRTLTNILNKTGEALHVGDSVELCAKGGGECWKCLGCCKA